MECHNPGSVELEADWLCVDVYFICQGESAALGVVLSLYKNAAQIDIIIHILQQVLTE